MTNMDKICKTQLNRENEITWQDIGLNNNREDEKNKEQSDCQSMKPKDKHKLEVFGNHNENTEASNTLLDMMNDSFGKTAVLTPNSNCSSTNNSTDNLSYLSDSCVIEEVLMLPNNLSDEEISVNSDDCVYAYRGADYDVSDQRAVPPDDETDFLEMDFDPDPPSEIEHNNESANNSRVGNPNCGFSGEETKGTGPKSFEADTVTRTTSGDKLALSNGSCSNSAQESNNHCEIPKYSPRQTGTKPKKMFTDRSGKVSKFNKLDESLSFATHQDEAGCPTREPDEACLDCLEKEFLLKTIGKKMEPFQCSKCNSKISYNTQGHSTPYKSFGFSDLPLLEDNIQFLQRNYQRNPLCNTVFKEKLLVTTKKETVSFLTVEADEVTIVQALEKIDATFNRDIIRNFFDSKHKIFKDVPELIVYMSKKNCDYKRMIKLIKSASMSELEITFSPNKKPAKAEVVQVSAFDILQSWTKRSDLGKLKKLDKRFSQMNVLGKIANLVRQAQQRNAEILNEFIAIPQYYETGYITINKK